MTNRQKEHPEVNKTGLDPMAAPLMKPPQVHTPANTNRFGAQISESRRVQLDRFVEEQFESIESELGYEPKLTCEEFQLAAMRRVGWSGKRPSSVIAKSEAEIEFGYLWQVFNKKWNKLSSEVKIKVEREAAQRHIKLWSLPAVDFLKRMRGASAECLLANYYCNEWCIEQRPEFLTKARQLFEGAANKGSLEALYALGTYALKPVEASYMSPEPTPVFLVDEEWVRRDYLERAADGGYVEARDKLAQKEEYESELKDHADDWERDNAYMFREVMEYEAKRRIRLESKLPVLRQLAENDDTGAAAVELASMLLARANDIRQCWDKAFCTEDQEDWLEGYQPNSEGWKRIAALESEASALLTRAVTAGNTSAMSVMARAEHLDISETDRLSLLRQAAFPDSGDEPIVPAVLELAKRRYKAGDFAETERCLKRLSEDQLSRNDMNIALADVYIREGRLSDAETILKNSSSKSSSQWAGLVLAEMIARQGGYDGRQLMRVYEPMVDKSPEAAFMTGLIELRAGIQFVLIARNNEENLMGLREKLEKLDQLEKETFDFESRDDQRANELMKKLRVLREGINSSLATQQDKSAQLQKSYAQLRELSQESREAIGCADIDENRVKERFESAFRLKNIAYANISGRPFDNWQAEMALGLGWGDRNGLARAIEMLLERMWSRHFVPHRQAHTNLRSHKLARHEMTEALGDCIDSLRARWSLTADDAKQLLSINSYFAEYERGGDNDVNSRKVRAPLDADHPEIGVVPLASHFFFKLIDGAFTDSPTNKDGSDDKELEPLNPAMLPKKSMVWSHFMGTMCFAGRIDGAGWKEAAEHFNRVLDFSKALDKEERTGYLTTNPTNYGALRRWLVIHAREGNDTAKRKQEEEERTRKETELARALEQERRQMISFLSHTLTSATSGTADLLRQLATEIITARGKDDLSAIARRLAPEIASTAMVESLVEVFKLYTSDPGALRDRWEQDLGGSMPLAQTCAMAIRQALLRFYFSTEFEASFGRMMPNADYEEVVGAFMEDILSLDMGQSSQLESFFQWIDVHLPFLRLTLESIDSLRLKQGGPRDIVIFAVVGEFLGNALKYAAEGGPITLRIRWIDDGLELVCSNPVDPSSPVPALGGRSGLSAIREVCRLVRAKFSEPAIEDNVFSLRVTLPIK